MANNVAITAGSGTTMRSDDVSGVQYPYVKLADGTEDSATVIASGNGVAAGALRVTLASDGSGIVTNTNAASEVYVGFVGGKTKTVVPTLTVTAGAYSAGDVISARQTLTNAMRVTSGTGILQDLTIICADGELLACTVVLFDSATASLLADNAAFAWGSGDQAKFLGAVSISASDWLTLGSQTVCHKQNLGIIVEANGSQNLYAYIIATATPTFAATTDVTIRYKFLQD